MTRTAGRIAGAVMAAVACAPPAAAQTPPVEVRTALSRTAVWIGDRVTYTVELRCAPQVDVLLDDLASGRLRIDGGDVVAVEEDLDDSGQGPVRRVRYTLVTYRVDVPELRIAAIPVRYYARRAGTAVQGPPAGQVTVAPAIIAVRSAIPDGDGVPPLRVPATLRLAPRFLALAQPVGLVLIAIAIVPVAIWGLDLAGRARRAWGRQRVRRSRRQQPVSLEQLRSIEPESDSARIHAFEQLDTLVREHLSLTTGITARALTPAEVRRALEARAPSLPHGDIEALLAACERARYAPQPPAAEDWPGALRDAEQILNVSRR